MSFAELLALKEELGSKVYNEAIFGDESASKQRKKNSKRKIEFKRENKNRPREISAKKQVPLLSAVKKPSANSTAATAPRDPRFDSNCGEFDRDKFKEDYSFVNEIREKEISDLKSQLKHLKGAEATEEKQKVKTVLQRMQNQNLEEKKLMERKQAMARERSVNKNAVKNERKPFFVPKRKSLFFCHFNFRNFKLIFNLKKLIFSCVQFPPKQIGEQKAKDLVKQFEELKKSGKLNKHLEKRRKKNLSRDRKKYQFD